MTEIEDRLLGKLALSNLDKIEGSLVLGLVDKLVISHRNIAEPLEVAENALKLWTAGGLFGSPRLLRLTTDKEYVLVGDDEFLVVAVLANN